MLGNHATPPPQSGPPPLTQGRLSYFHRSYGPHYCAPHLTVARSLSGSDSPPNYHSIPSRRFATPYTGEAFIFPPQSGIKKPQAVQKHHLGRKTAVPPKLRTYVRRLIPLKARSPRLIADSSESGRYVFSARLHQPRTLYKKTTHIFSHQC